MQNAPNTFHEGRLNKVSKALAKNGFTPHIAATAADAKDIVLGDIITELANENSARSASFGGSMTLVNTGIHEGVKSHPLLEEVLDTYDTTGPRFEVLALRRKALLVDIFLTSTNALTMDGKLVNLDGTGNRVAALAYGPKHIIIVTGRNKIVDSLDDAMHRVKHYAAPINAIRLGRKTPCVQTLRCENCSSPDRICNTWTITEKSWPKGRIHVVLVNEDLGY